MIKNTINQNTKFLYPLDLTYLAIPQPLPKVERIPPDSLPQPYSELLNHKNDMTETLENFYQQKLHLNVLEHQTNGETLMRQVSLDLPDSKPVEFGAIRIYLSHFDSLCRDLILEGEKPLGAILQEHGIPHRANPKTFFRLWSDAIIENALNLKESCWLFGRQNVHLDPSDNTLAEIIEILPPCENA